MSKPPSLSRAKAFLANENSKYPPTLVEIPRAKWPRDDDPDRLRVWRSRKYLVQLQAENGTQRLSVCRTELDKDGNWKDGLTWDELTKIKAEAGFEGCWMVELFPPDFLTVNVANMRHLWLLPEPPSYAWAPRDAEPLIL